MRKFCITIKIMEMKKFILPICALALCAGFFSCDEDDEESVSFEGKHLKKFSYYVYNEFPKLLDPDVAREHPNELDSLGNPMGWKTVVDSTLKEVEFGYDSKGRIIQIEAASNFVYKGSSLTWGDSKNGVVNEYYNSLGYITSYKSVYGNSENNETYEYDSSWHILSAEINTQGKFTNENDEPIIQTESYKNEYVWEDGNVVKIYSNAHYAAELGRYPYTLKYTDEDVTVPIENKVNCPFLCVAHPIDFLYNMVQGYRYGAKNKNLPVDIISNDGVWTKLVWTLDDDGYPVGLRFGTVTCMLVWE